jgi:hypothetical protein
MLTEGASRIFYKCPPPMMTTDALRFYGIDQSVYASLYYAPVRVPHNVREPSMWLQLIEMKSPFNIMYFN